MTQLLLNVEDDAILPSLKQMLAAIQGVSFSIPKQSEACDNEDITQTQGYKEAMEDKRKGRVYHADSVDDLFEQILG